jgi:hypothetical protein
LLTNVNEYNPAFTERINGYIHNFMAKGVSYADAKMMAMKAIEGSVINQIPLFNLQRCILGSWYGFIMFDTITLPAKI